MSERRTQRRNARHEKRVARQRAKAVGRQRYAPGRIRTAAGWCFIFGILSVLGGCASYWDTPEFGGDAYTEMVTRLAFINGSVAWLAAVALIVAGALLKALADILEELRGQSEDILDELKGRSEPGASEAAGRLD